MTLETGGIMATTKAFIEHLWSRRAPNLPAEALADVLDRLVWCLADNGAEVLQVRDEWLAGDDLGKIRVALAMSEVFPAGTREELVALCARLSTRCPEVSPRCDELLRGWDQQFRAACDR